MSQCPSCDAANDAGVSHCAVCGTDVERLAPGALIGGRYEILERLGRGGMGVVFRAHDREFNDVVALKVLRTDTLTPEAVRRFREEIRLARKVTHHNVCRMHEYGEDGDLRYLSMAFMDGIDLRRILRERGPLPAEEGFAVAVAVAEGLQAIHDEGIIHRDLKTPNIMRGSRGVVKVMDFGIAKAAASDGIDMTRTGMIVGTPEYMSPEQVRGEKLGFESDVYALGIVIFEMFTGHVPFRGETPVATLMKQLQEPPPLTGSEADRIPAALVPILERALAKAPGDRYPTARDLAAALVSASRMETSAVAPASVVPTTSETSASALLSGPVPGVAVPPMGRDAPDTISEVVGRRPRTAQVVATAAVGIVILLFAWRPWARSASSTSVAPGIPETTPASTPTCVSGGGDWPARIRLEGFDPAMASQIASRWPFVAVVGASCDVDAVVSAGPPVVIADQGGPLWEPIHATGEAALSELGTRLQALHLIRLLLGPQPGEDGLEIRIARGASTAPERAASLKAGLDRVAYWVKTTRLDRLAVLEIDASGTVSVLYPNQYEKARLRPDDWVRIPATRSIPVEPPRGSETVVAIAFDDASSFAGLDQAYPGLWEGPGDGGRPFRDFRGMEARRFAGEVSRRLSGAGWTRAPGRFRIE